MHRALYPHLRSASLPCTYRPTALRTRTLAHASTRKPKEEGSIASVFSSLSGSDPALPARFSDLKKEIWREFLVKSWREVLDELKISIEQVAQRGADVLELTFASVAADTD
jgi:acyl carrier protein phosphodiesterase